MATFDINSFAELQQALTQSKTNGQEDIINLKNNITITDNLPLIEEDVSLTINGGRFEINGNNTYRPFFVKSGTVIFDNLIFINGKAKGGDGSGGGAGMGGALFVYDGNVTVSNATFSNNQAVGGNGGSGSDGGIGIDSGFGSGGSKGVDGDHDFYPYPYDHFYPYPWWPGTDGGNGGNGGFGGGGGKGGLGGFNDWWGSGEGNDGNGGTGGFGGGSNGGGGAGMGGAIFVRSGSLTLGTVAFNNNQATGGTGGNDSSTDDDGKGLGGAIFVLHTTENTNGNNQGMPTSLPTVTASNITFSGNSAADDTGEEQNNDDVFGATIIGVPPNSGPTDITLTSNNINENVAEDETTVGFFSTTDLNNGDTFTYTLVSGDGDTDNDAFELQFGELRIKTPPDFETQSSYSIRVQTDDGKGGIHQKALTININDINEAPTDLNLSNNTIDENIDAGSVIGDLTITDSDTSDTFTYSFADGGVDNSAFEIVGNQLKINDSPDFETKPNYSIRVRSTDGGGLTYEKSLVININDINEVPTDFNLSDNTINENVAADSIIGNFTTLDPDANDTFIYTLIDGGVDNSAFEIVGNQLKINASPDFEVKSSYNIRVQTDDNKGGTFQKSFTININDVEENTNDASIDLRLDSTSIDENVAAGSIIGNFTTINPDANDTTYILIDGEGDNSAFEIVGNQLKIKASPDFETKSNYSIRVQTNDNKGGTFQKSFTININDVEENNSTIQPPVDSAKQIIRSVTKDGNEMEVIDLRDKAGQTVMATYEISRDADYNNNIYFYKVDSDLGNIGDLTPDRSGYLEKVLGNIVNPNAGLTTADGIKGETGSFNFMGGDIFGVAIVANGTLEQALSNINSVEGVYLSHMGAGASTDNGNFDHIRFNSTTSTFEFEDLANGGDKDFNDIKIKMNF